MLEVSQVERPIRSQTLLSPLLDHQFTLVRESWSKPKLCLCLPRGLAGSSEVFSVERTLSPHALYLSTRTENELSLVFRVNKMSRFSSNKTTLQKSFYAKSRQGKALLTYSLRIN